jgi:hypothetical protein
MPLGGFCANADLPPIGFCNEFLLGSKYVRRGFSSCFWAVSAPIGDLPPSFSVVVDPPPRFLHRTAIRILIGGKYDGLPMNGA